MKPIPFGASAIAALLFAASPCVIAAHKQAPAPAAAVGIGERAMKEKKADLAADRAEIDAFFDAQDVVPSFAFDFPKAEWGYLHDAPRRYAECTMTEAGNPRVWEGVGVKLKGSLGSFRGPDDKPGLSISMNKFKRAERWRGFLKWRLNNGAQDDTYLNEQISCEMARAAGVPASRCAHALVRWQGRDLGLYVFKESFDKDFLSHFFRNTGGDLYEVGTASDLAEDMEKSLGDPERRENVKELIEASQEPDDETRWKRLGKILDVDEFLSFTAVEALTCHWDGYNFNRNNYRLYFDADSGKACFFIHGTDQTFGDANFSITRQPDSIVGRAVMSNPAWRDAYRERLAKIYHEVLLPIDWPARAAEVGGKVRDALAKADEQAAKDYEGRIADAHDRIAARIAAIGHLLESMKPISFDAGGIAHLPSEAWRQEGESTDLDQADLDGVSSLHIRARAKGAASWRQTVNLDPGKYRLEGRIRTAKVVAVKDPKGAGAGLRISGSSRSPKNSATGNSAWKQFSFDFDWAGGDANLVAELRASKGEAWFDQNSLDLVKLR